MQETGISKETTQLLGLISAIVIYKTFKALTLVGWGSGGGVIDGNIGV